MRLSQMTIRGLMIGVAAASLLFAIVRVANEPDETVFLGTVTRIDNMGDTPDPFLRYLVTLKIDNVIRGRLPMETFQLAIHSPSQEGVELGHQYRIPVRRSRAGYDYCGPHPWLLVPPDSLGPK
jgi:hypothetical protein